MDFTEHYFASGGLRCAARMYMPDSSCPPVVLLGHGYGAEQDFGNSNLVQALVEQGLAAFTFDYRYFGASEGEPRQLMDVNRRLEDWRAALEYLRGLSGINTSEIALWGSSFGGGHALSIAAEDSAVKAVIAQVPHCDAKAVFKQVPGTKTVASIAHGLWGKLAGLLGGEHRVAIVGRPGEGFAVMDSPGWYESYLRLAGDSTSWTNSIPAQSLLIGSDYSPIDHVASIQCPVLIIAARGDQLVPIGSVEGTAARIADCTLQLFDGDHFDLYDNEPFNTQGLAWQLEFLAKHLQG